VCGAAGAAKRLSGRRSLPGFSRGLTGALLPDTCHHAYWPFTLKDEMTAGIHGTLTGHIFADFIHDLRGGQFPLPGITAAGINQGFVLTQDIAALWCKFHTFSP
jgi:hypothetical protein